MAFLRSAFSLARRSGVLKVSPWFPMLREDNVRTGFLRDEDYPGLASACSLEGIWMRGIMEIANAWGWRSDSIRSLRVRQVDFEDGSIRLDDTKNGEPVEAKMTSVIRQVMEACCAGKHPDARVFTRPSGRPVLSFRKAWARATAAAGVPGLLFHDLCRTAMRNMRRLGIDESVAMDVSGRRTNAIFKRYNIVDGKDRADVARRLDEKQAVVIVPGIVPRGGEPMAEAVPVQPALFH
jgi:integrase